MWPIQDFQRTNLAISILGIILINEEKNRYNLNVPLIMCNILPLIMCNTLNGTLLMFDLSKKKKKKKNIPPCQLWHIRPNSQRFSNFFTKRSSYRGFHEKGTLSYLGVQGWIDSRH